MQSAEGSRNGNEIMKVELIDIGRVIPYARNPRRNEQAIARVAATISLRGMAQKMFLLFFSDGYQRPSMLAYGKYFGVSDTGGK